MLSNALKSIKGHNYISAEIDDQRAEMMIDMTNIPFDENHLDLIVANHILEYIPDDKKALRELHRVLKADGGEAILQVPISLNNKLTCEDSYINTEADKLKAFGQKDHVRIYGQDYQEKLRLSGFHVRVFDWKSFSKLNPKGKNKFGLIENENENENVVVVKLGS
jgi:ubiquinone/menaquinone biosynthesis C-methylase UbiE